MSTGGLFFETLSQDLTPGQRLEMELTIPPGDGYFPYQGRVTADAKVVRVVDLPPTPCAEGMAHLPRHGVAAAFNANLKLSF